MSITQKHIADALNLSVITVSRALRGHPDLSRNTRERVLEKARELDYSKGLAKAPAPSAPSPRRVGIYLYETPGAQEDPLASGVKRSIFLALQRECQRLQVETLIETRSRDEAPLLTKNNTIHAAFIFGRYTPECVKHLQGIPALAVSSFIDCHGLPRIVADNVNGMREATEHLIGLGHRDILFVTQRDPHTRIFDERADGYLSAMHRHGLAPHVLPISPHHRTDAAALRNFTAFACASDGLAHALQAQLLADGVRVPEDRSIVGFDDLAADSPFPLTTYAPDWKTMGRIAAGLLLSRPLDIRGLDVAVTVPGRLLVRNSTAKAA